MLPQGCVFVFASASRLGCGNICARGVAGVWQGLSTSIFSITSFDFYSNPLLFSPNVKGWRLLLRYKRMYDGIELFKLMRWGLRFFETIKGSLK